MSTSREYIKQGYDEFKHYYVDNEENQMVRPEFVKGVYNAISHTFTPNRNFYKNFKINYIMGVIFQ